MDQICKLPVYARFDKVLGCRTLPQLIKAIQEPHFRDKIKQIRGLLHQEKKEAAGALKKELLAFTVSGIFHPSRKLEHLKQYTQYLVLDFDHLSPTQLEQLRNKTPLDPYSIAGFTSPGGHGYKIFSRVDTAADQHAFAFQRLCRWYEKEYGLAPDASGKDITRLCFMSYDPDAWFRTEGKEVFPVHQHPLSVQDLSTEHQEALEDLKQILFQTQEQSNYEKGNRNNFLYLFANNANRAGHSISTTISFAQEHFSDLPKQEIIRTVNSAYHHHPYEHNTSPTARAHYTEPSPPLQEARRDHFPPLRGGRGEPSPPLREDQGEPSPLFSIDFNTLPDPFRSGCQALSEPRARDIFLTTSLAILSAGLEGVSGIYDHQINYPNLFVFVVAPPAGGKSALRFARILGSQIHRNKKKDSKAALNQYHRHLAAYNEAVLKPKKSDKPSDIPTKPPLKTWFIPANTSSAMLIKHLNDNGGIGMICESEADTLNNVFKQDWGTYSDILRKAFHFEPISYSRKGTDERFELEEPRLGVALSGTPNQLFKLIPSAEDGLFSRFLFYQFGGTSKWKDVSPGMDPHHRIKHFESLAVTTLELSKFINAHPCEFQLEKEQWKQFNQHFSKLFQDTPIFSGEESVSVIKRHGAILFRIAMILSACRRFERQDRSPVMVCEDLDFMLAFDLVKTFLQHALQILPQLPKAVNARARNGMANHKRDFYQQLPRRFQRKEAVAIGARFDMIPRTVDRFLSKLLKTDYLIQPEYGYYQKPPPERKV